MEERTTVVIDIQLDEDRVANELAAVNREMASLRSENAKMKKEVKDGTKTWEEVSAALASNESRLKALKASQSALSSQVVQAKRATLEYGSSLKEQSALLSELRNRYQSLSKQERESAGGQELLKHIQDLDAAVKAADYSQGQFQRNVGNYPGAMKPLEDALAVLTQKMEELQAAGQADSDEFKELTKQAADVKAQMQQLQQSVDGLATETGSVKQQMRELTENLIAMKMRGEENTEQYRQMLEQLGKMKDAMMDTQNEVKQMASDTSSLNSVLQGAQAAAGGFSVALGVMNLVGDKDSETAKELAEAQQKLQAAIAITTGLQALQNALQKESALMMGVTKLQAMAATKAQDLYTASLGRATVAQRLFNTVAKSNPYALLAGLILSVVGAIGVFNLGSSEQEQQLEDTNQELNDHAKLLKELTDSYDTLNKRAEHYIENQIEWAKEEGKSTEEIRALEEKLFQNRLAQFKAEEKRIEEIGYSYEDLTALYQRNLDEQTRLAAQRTDAIMRGDEKEAQSIQNKLKEQKEFTDYLKSQLDYLNDFNSRYDEFLLQDRQRLNRYKQEDADKEKQAEEERQRQEAAAAAAAKQRAQEAKARREEERRKQKEYADLTLSEEQKAEDARNELIENEFERRRAIEDTAYSRQLAALEQSMAEEEKEHGKNTALYASYLDQIESLRRQHINTMLEIAKDEFDEEQAFNEFRLQALKELKEELAAMEDETEEAQVSKMQKFAEAYKENAQAIQETSSALQSSFGSMSSMYKQMAQDESKTEADREAAAKKARAWSALQIAANAGTAVAKGVASAMDTPWPANIAAIATTLASVLSAIAQAKQLLAETSGYETGGVIGGYRGATMGRDNAVASVRTGEMVLNAKQQRTLFEIANGAGASTLTASLVEALQAMPAPVLVYSELQQFGNTVNILDNNAKLK